MLSEYAHVCLANLHGSNFFSFRKKGVDLACPLSDSVPLHLTFTR